MRTIFLIFIVMGVLSATMGCTDVHYCTRLAVNTIKQCKDEGGLKSPELDLCLMEKQGWITPEDTLDVAKAVDSIGDLIVAQVISEEIFQLMRTLRVATQKCFEAGNSLGNDKTTRVGKMIECWNLNMEGPGVFLQAFCFSGKYSTTYPELLE